MQVSAYSNSFRFRPFCALHIQNLSNRCKHKIDPSISRFFKSNFWRVFGRLAQLCTAPCAIFVPGDGNKAHGCGRTVLPSLATLMCITVSQTCPFVSDFRFMFDCLIWSVEESSPSPTSHSQRIFLLSLHVQFLCRALQGIS